MNHLTKSLARFLTLSHADGDQGGGGGGNGSAGGSEGAGGAAGGQGGAATATAPGAFDIRQHVDDSGSFKTGWDKAAGVSESLAKKFTRPEALARSYEQLEKQIGAKGIIPPGPNATQADKDAFYKALGRPDKAEDYGFVKPDKIKVGDKEVAVPDTAWDKTRAANWQAKLHAMGVPKEQAQAIMQAAVEESITGMDMINGAAKQAQQQARAALVTEWGGEEGYKANMELAAKAAKEFGGEELMKHPGLANDPVMIRTLAKMGKAIGETPGAGTRQQAGEGNQPTASEAKEQAAALTKKMVEMDRADRQWKNSAEAARMKEQKSALFKVAYPDKQRG